MDTYLQVLKKYADFSGRASRKEYWVFILFNITFVVIAMILDNILGIAMKEVGIGPLYGIYVLAILIPGIAVAVRRLHDIGKSGWMIFVALIPLIGGIWLLILLLTSSNLGENQYGSNPKDVKADDSFADELILLSIIMTFLSIAFWQILPKIYNNFHNTLAPEIASKYLSLIFGLIPLSLAFAVKNKSKRILLIIVGGLILLFHFYGTVMQFVN